jgi:protein-S-isoprenylcysteine O-methyltransferase Ste14
MGVLGYFTIALSAVWFATEININIRKRSRGASEGRDRLSFIILWLTTIISITVAVLIKVHPEIVGSIGRITLLSPLIGYFGCLLMVLGLVIRLIAIATLRQQFTVDVSIVEDHKIIDAGIYGVIRHPAYLGSLVSFFGLGLALENWVGLIVVFFLPLAAISYRIHVEEKALTDHFGLAYQEYARRTKRLIPKVY